MDTLPDRLRALTEKKYFAVLAVVFFAFITAVIFALLAQQQTVQNVDQLRTDIRQGVSSGTNAGRSANGNNNNNLTDDAEESPSLINRVVSRLTGRSSRTTQRNTQNNPASDQPTQGNTRTGQNISSGTIIPSEDQEETRKKIDEVVMPLPKVVVRDYVLQTELPNSPQSAKIYKLKTNYTESDIEKMAATFGMASLKSNDVVIEDNNNGLIQIFDLKNNLYLAVNNRNGRVLFSAQNGIPAVSQGDAKQNALALARSLGFSQACLKATSSYTKKSEPHTTFVDIHCDWESVGAPIVNYFGILNLPINEALKDVKLGQLPLTSSANTNDIKDEDSGEFSSRPNDFNTITLQQDTLTGNIMAFSSNIMPVVAEIEVSADRIIPPTDGFEKLRNNEKQFAFVGPQGAGTTDLRNAYINNIAQADSVQLTDFVLAYPVIPGIKQEYMCPEWVTRSQGRLETGYDGTFVESARAINDSRCTRPAVLGTSIAQAILPNPIPTVIDSKSHGDTLQYKNFIVQGDPVTESSCPAKESFTNAMQISEGVYLLWIDRNVRGPGNKRLGTDGTLTGPLIPREWWIGTISEQQVAGALGTGEKISPEKIPAYMRFRATRGVKSTIGSRDDNPISSVKGTIVACKYLTTGSPSLYIFSAYQQNVRLDVNPVGGIVFAQPPLTSSLGWNIKTQSNGMLDFGKGIANNRAYYEYDKKALSEALANERYKETGYTVKKDELVQLFEKTIAPSIKLSDAQTFDLVAEVKRELDAISHPYAKVVLLPRALLDQYLPVHISPKPDIFYRYFFIITGTDKVAPIMKPNISPITKSSYYSIETGTLFPNSQ